MLVVIILSMATDVYIGRRLLKSSHPKLAAAHWALAGVLIFAIIVIACMDLHSADTPNETVVAVQYMLYAYFCCYIPKWIGSGIHSLHRLRFLTDKTKRFVKCCGLLAGVLTLIVMLSGLWPTPHSIQVNEVTLQSDRLPAGFDGYRILQWSDAHLGTYCGDTTYVAEFLRTLNDLHPDAIVFTGDLVNRRTNEAFPYRQLMASLHAPDGVYSVLGNHDYDDYVTWADNAAKQNDRLALIALQQQAGWRLLNNDHVVISRGGDQIVLIGTENYGDPPFPKLGDTDKAYDGKNDDKFKILLQHNPYAWRASVLPNTNIDLMLSGHTHAMQIMFSVAGHRMSPARFRYKEWGGLYQEGNRYLYVNTGMGMVGPPMRIGATPEITVLTLKTKKQ